MLSANKYCLLNIFDIDIIFDNWGDTMQYKDIEIFLELVNTRNITKTSENLFLAQSVISTRLKKLEDELGYSLFTRSKGLREIELTREGKEFTNLAMRLQSLYDEAASIGDFSRNTLRIAAPETIFLNILEPIIFNMLRQDPDIKIAAEMADSSVVYEMMDANLVDFGFASYESSHHNIVHRHIHNQAFSLVMGSPSSGTINLSELDPTKEIIFTGGNFSTIDLWRDSHFPGIDSSRIRINSTAVIARYLLEFEGSWAILPRDTAVILSDLYGTYVCALNDPPASREIYFLSHSSTYKSSSPAAEMFLKELKAYEQL